MGFCQPMAAGASKHRPLSIDPLLQFNRNMVLRLILVLSLMTRCTLPLAAQEGSFPSYLDQASSSDLEGATAELPDLGVAIEPYQPNSISYPGLVQRIWSMNLSDNPTIDVRVSPRASVYVPEGETVSPFLPPGPFGFEMEGVLQFEDRAIYDFRAEGTGKARIEVHGELAFEATGELSEGTRYPHLYEEGSHPIRIRYEGPDEGTSVFRLLWSSETFREEPVSSEFLSHDFIAEDLKRSNLLRLGRDSVAKYRCLNCHAWEGLDSDIYMPELDRDAPTFEGIGSRYHRDWMVKKILSPHSIGVDREMPTLLHPHHRSSATEEAERIATYLSSLQDPGLSHARLELDNTEPESRGATLFEEQNCAACHIPPLETPEEKEDRIPLDNLDEKWKPSALVDFLQNPDKHYRWIKMPDFGFNPQEAESLAAYLLSATHRVEVFPLTFRQDVGQGRELVKEHQCLQCHTTETPPSTQGTPPSTQENPPPKPLPSLRGGGTTIPPLRIAGRGLGGGVPSRGGVTSAVGCLAASAEARGYAPDFHLSEDEREGLTLFLEESLDSLNRSVPAEFAQRQMNQLQCQNCHQGEVEEFEEVGWESFVSLGAILSATREEPEEEFEDFEEEEEWADSPVDATVSEHQSLPALTWAGEKLQTDWIESLLTGELETKTRPLLPARMPSFPAVAKPFGSGLARLHGIPESTRESSDENLDLILIGEKLLLDPPGLNCIACHPVGDHLSTSGLQGSSINLEHAPARLRRPFFERLITNPQRVLPATPMPQFIYSEGITAATAYLQGDASKQLEAIWIYLASLENP